MVPPTIPELVARAGKLPFLCDHLALADGAQGAYARLRDFRLESV